MTTPAKITASVPKTDNSYWYMVGTGALLFFLSNTYYGWNETAQSGGERVWDIIWNSLIIFGFFGVIARSVAVEVFEQMSMQLEINGEVKAKTEE